VRGPGADDKTACRTFFNGVPKNERSFQMAKQFDFAIPTPKALIKTAIELAVIMFAIRMTPDTWGIKKWFMAA
jgi:hypothetical protein